MSSNSDDPWYPEQEEHVRKVDKMLRERTPPVPEPETEDEVHSAADRDPADPVANSGGPAYTQRTDDEQLAPEAEVEAGLDAAEDEAQSAGEAASEDDLNR